MSWLLYYLEKQKADERGRRLDRIVRRRGQVFRRASATARDLEMLEVTCEAMWSILSERFGVTNEQLQERIEQLMAEREREAIGDGPDPPAMVDEDASALDAMTKRTGGVDGESAGE